VSADPVVGFALAALVIGAAGWLSWRRPTALLALALASLAVRPQLFAGGAPVGYEWGFHHTLLLLALVANALHFGIRRTMYWPVAGLLAAVALTVAAGDLHPELTPGLMLMSLGVFVLPWLCTSVVLEPGSRRLLVLVIMLTPLLSVAIGAFMTAAGIHSSFPRWHRLQGATGNPAAFAILAFAGFAVALHEMSRPKRPFAGALAVINLALVILSGTRMAIAAAGVFLCAYLMLSTTLRQRLSEQRAKTAVGIAVITATLLWYWPTLHSRIFEWSGVGTASVGATDLSIDLSGRDTIWKFYFEELAFSPLFGRGIGAGFVAPTDWLQGPRQTPHNEYLHLLVSVGVIGFVLCAAAIGLWYRRLLQMASENDRPFLLALLPAIGVFAITEDVLVFSTGLVTFAYLGVLLTRRSPRVALPHARKRHRRRSSGRASRARTAATPRGGTGGEAGTSAA
jgi:teichuronic acid biosynthesis protein TuaE